MVDVLNLLASAQRHAFFTVFVVIAASASAAALAVVVAAPTPATPAIAAAILALFGALFAFAFLGVAIVFVRIIVLADGFGRRSVAILVFVFVVIFDVGDIAFQFVEVFFGALRGGGGMFGLFAKPRVAVFLRNLVIIGVDLDRKSTRLNSSH